MSRFAGKTYSRVKGKDTLASQAFDDIFDRSSKPATRTAATVQKWGKTTFTSVRDSKAASSPDPKRRKLQTSPSSDPFTFESSDEGGISPMKKPKAVAAPVVENRKKATNNAVSQASVKKFFSKNDSALQTAPSFPAVPDSDSKSSQESVEHRPVKRFFRTHKGFLERDEKEKSKLDVAKPNSAVPKLRTVIKKKTTPDNCGEKQLYEVINSQDSSTSGIFLSSSTATDPDWLTQKSRDQSPDRKPPSSSASISDTFSSIPSSNVIAKNNDRIPCSVDSLSPPSSPYKDRESLFDAVLSNSPSKTCRRSAEKSMKNSSQNSTDSSSIGGRPLSMFDNDHRSNRGPVPMGPPKLLNSKTIAVVENSGRGTPSPPTLKMENDVKTTSTSSKTEVTLEEGEFVFNDEDLIVIRGSKETDDSQVIDNSESLLSQGSSQSSSQDTVKCDSQDSPSSQGATNKRLLLKKSLSNSPKKSPAKRYNPRQWINPDGSPEEKSQGRSTTSNRTSSQLSRANTTGSYDFGDDSAPPPKLTRQARTVPPRGVITNREAPGQVMALKVAREHKELYTVVQNVKDVHECQEHGETQEFQDDIAYLLDGLNDTQTVTTRCLSTLSLANKCIEPVFRMHLRAHGTVTRIFTALKDACHNPCLAMSTSLIMFMLSRDRLSVDMDQDGMEMMINLLNADMKNKKMRPGLQKDFMRIKQRVQDVIAQLKKDGGAKNMELSEISTSNLATETLLALTSRRSGDSFKEEIRTFGGLDHIVEMVSDCTDRMDDDITELSDVLIDTLKKIDRCLRVVENVTYLNKDNQTYLIAYSSSSLINSLCSLLRLTQRFMELFPAPEPEPAQTDQSNDKSANTDKKPASPQHPSQLVFQCLLSVLRVLLNITHDNVWGSQKVGQTEGLMNSALMCALHIPQFAPHDERFDLLVLCLGMIINLVEHCELNRRLLVNTETMAYYDSDDSSKSGLVEALEALTQLFRQKESAAGQLEATVMTAPGKGGDGKNKVEGKEVALKPNTCDESGEWEESDSGLLWVIGKKKKPKNNQNGDDESDDEEQHIEIIPSSVEDEENFTKALHKAGKHMEDSIVAAYVALLIGCIIKENKSLVEKVREHLPDGSFEPMVNILTKFLGFMNLTSNMAAQHSSKSIIEIIQIMDKS